MATNWFRKHLPSFAAALLAAVFLAVYAPTVTYLTNANSFPFGLTALMAGMALPFLVVAVVMTILLIDLDTFVFAPGLIRTNRTGGEVSPAHVFVALIVFAMWLEGFLLSRGLPVLTGEANLFSSPERRIWDSAIWLGIIVIGLAMWRRLAKRILTAYLCLALLLAAGIADASISGDAKIRPNADVFHVLDHAAFSPDDNVVMLVVDAMSSALVQEYLADNPDAAARLDGFTFFKNNLESASSTQWSLPSILKGDIYPGGPVQDYQRSSFDAPSSLARRLYEAGYDVYASSTLPMFNRLMLHDDARRDAPVETTPVRFSFRLYGQLILRFVPYVMKNWIANRIGYDTASYGTREGVENLADSGDNALTRDQRAFLALERAAGSPRSSRPAFHFHHVHGAHVPYEIDRAGQRIPWEDRHSFRGLMEQSAWTLDAVIHFLDTLKNAGIYDDATVVLLGDHGDRFSDQERRFDPAYADHAALLVKPPGSRGPVRVSPAPTSNMYLADMVTAIHLNGGTLRQVTAELPATRRIFYGDDGLVEFAGTATPELRIISREAVEQSWGAPTVLQKNIRYTFSVVKSSGADSPLAVPSGMDASSIALGWGLRPEAANSSFSLLTDIQPGTRLRVWTSVTTATKPGLTVPEQREIRLQDRVSGREFVVILTGDHRNVWLDGIVVSPEGTIDLDVTVQPFLQNAPVYFEDILLRDAEEKEMEF